MLNPFKKYTEKKQKQRVDELLQFGDELLKIQREINKPKPKSA